MTIETLEYIGAAAAIIGSLMITHKLPGFTYGFVFFLVASISLALFFWHTKQYGALAMELVFVYTNLVGIRKWIWEKME